MDANEAKAILARGAGQDVAFVPERAAERTLAEALCAMANARGGVVLLGVTKAGAIRGVRDADAQAEVALTAALLADPPIVLPIPQPVQLGGRTCVVVQVPRGLPNVYKLDGRYLVRDGPTNRDMPTAQVHRLMALRGVISFEAVTPPGAATGDLDWERVRQYTTRLQPASGLEAQALLQRRGCLIERDGAPQPTYGGLLLFGRAPEQWIRGALVSAVRYPGRQMGDEFVREEIDGPLSDQIRRAEAFLRAHTGQSITLAGLEHSEAPTYPQDVLREVVVNAVAHRDYAIQGESIRISVYLDRIEVYSPGRLPGHVTVKNIVEERFSRNPIVVQVLADMGFIERLGYGIDRMLRLLDRDGHPPPKFEETAAGFRVTLYSRSALSASSQTPWEHLQLNPRQEKALRYVIRQERITNREYQQLSPDVSAETIRRDLSDLVHKDVLLRIGRKRATYYILKDASLAER